MTVTRSALRRSHLMVLALLSVLVAVGAATLLLVPDRAMDRLQLVIAPHPDDEFLAFPALEDAPGTYTVVVALTRGESTTRCVSIDQYLQQEAGERPPDPLPTASRSPECAEARRDSWVAFLNDAGSLTREVRLGPGSETETVKVVDARFGGEAEVWRGRDAGRILLSLGDGELSEPEVVAAVEGVLSLRGTALPDLPLERVVLASYWRPVEGSAVEVASPAPLALTYEHADHQAVTMAAPAIASRAGADTWVNVPPDYTPALALSDGGDLERVTRAMPAETYQAYLELEPQEGGPALRIGALQVNYGWLAFPGQAWSAGEIPDEESGVLFARVQDYLIVEAP